jgi:hypothetical protein
MLFCHGREFRGQYIREFRGQYIREFRGQYIYLRSISYTVPGIPGHHETGTRLLNLLYAKYFITMLSQGKA